MKKKNVIEQIDKGIADTIQVNREKLRSIIASLIFCGTHDIAIRGKHANEGNFEDLLLFRVQCGDKVLEEHLKVHGGKAKYTSSRVQNELINICGLVIQQNIVKEVNQSLAFSLLADETADISGKEQLSVGVRYVSKDGEGFKVMEEFLGFSELNSLDAEGITNSILEFVKKLGTDMKKLIGLGFDGCSTMAGHENGVQARIKAIYPKAVYFHCASHRLNLVVNDLNSVQDVRNTVGTIKQVIKFFRESVLRRKAIPNIPMLCETRWSHKYKSIRIFKENFIQIKDALNILSNSTQVNQDTRSLASQLYSATSSVKFILCLHIIARYSSYLEPIANKLQYVDCDLQRVSTYINTDLIKTFKKHSATTEEFSGIYKEVVETCEELEVELKIPRIAKRQTLRANVNTSNPMEYYRITIFNSYLDSMLVSLTTRFGTSSEVPFKGGLFHPYLMKQQKKEDFINNVQLLEDFYGIENLTAEARLWFDVWADKECPEKICILSLLRETLFYPAVNKMLIHYQTIPPTTSTVERSFSTLRRVKTWLRSTIGEERLSSLCLLSVHRKRVKELDFVEKVLDMFSQKKRNLQFAFSEKY